MPVTAELWKKSPGGPSGIRNPAPYTQLSMIVGRMELTRSYYNDAPLERPLRILHLEDTPADRELVRLSLESEGLTCEITYAASRAEFEAALGVRQFDLILSDFTLPSYHGAHALAFAASRCPEVPYVFVSGTIGEDRAIESLKAGATDYVLKGNLDRLWPAVRRALREAADRAKHKGAVEALRQSEERFREMAENIQDVFWVATPDTRRVLYVSPAFETVWGRSVDALYARSAVWGDSVVESDRLRFQAAREELIRGRKYHIEYRIRRPDGTVRWLEERGYPIFESSGNVKRTLGAAADITESKELQYQLIQAQKMEAIGLLAGGVAHDFNNVLSVINGYAEMLLETKALGEGAIEPLRQIYAAGRRAASLTRQLLVFSRRQTLNQQVIDLNSVIHEIAKMLGRLIGEQIKVELLLPRDLPRINADTGMMEQVIVNLAVNARDAMPEGGTLTIETKLVELTGDEPHRPEPREGAYIRLSIRDSGCGIPPENLRRIFEPFFTTKPAGQGTGLGLATVFGIVQQHHGWIEVDSMVNVGTSFHVFFPAVPRGDTSNPFATQSQIIRGGNETILLVEDEAVVRECAAMLLHHCGYRVIQAATGAEAMDLWQKHESGIKLLLTDVVLPDRFNGVQLADTLRAGQPLLRVLLTSGYRNETAPLGLEGRPHTRFIHKPYDLNTLTRTVRDLLDEPV